MDARMLQSTNDSVKVLPWLRFHPFFSFTVFRKSRKVLFSPCGAAGLSFTIVLVSVVAFATASKE